MKGSYLCSKTYCILRIIKHAVARGVECKCIFCTCYILEEEREEGKEGRRKGGRTEKEEGEMHKAPPSPSLLSSFLPFLLSLFVCTQEEEKANLVRILIPPSAFATRRGNSSFSRFHTLACFLRKRQLSNLKKMFLRSLTVISIGFRFVNSIFSPLLDLCNHPAFTFFGPINDNFFDKVKRGVTNSVFSFNFLPKKEKRTRFFFFCGTLH